MSCDTSYKSKFFSQGVIGLLKGIILEPAGGALTQLQKKKERMRTQRAHSACVGMRVCGLTAVKRTPFRAFFGVLGVDGYMGMGGSAEMEMVTRRSLLDERRL